MTSSLRDLASELRTDAGSAKAVPALAAGLTSGLALLVAQVAYGSLIFSGPLAPYSSQGVGLVLFGNFAACLVIALAGGFRGAISGLSPALVLVMAHVGATIGGSRETLFVTTVCALAIGAVAAGVCFLAIWRYGLANLVRFVPYSVAAGFIAGIGGAVCLAAMSLMVTEPDWHTVPALLQPPELWKWLPGVVFGAALYFAMKRWGRPLIMPVGVGLAVGGYHLALILLGISGDEARVAGLLLTSTSEASLWPSLAPADLAHIDWFAIATHLPTLLLLVFVALIVVIMNFAGLEMASHRDLDWNREFRATGIATIVAGLGGGTTASLIVPASLRSMLFGAATRLTGIVAALVIAAAVFLGDGMLELVPVPLVGGILVFAGFGMLDEGLLRSRKRLPWTEYGVIVLIAVVTMVFGLFEGVGVGMLAAFVFFAARLSRIDPVGECFTVRERRSTRSRSVPDSVILHHGGDRVPAWRLRGYVFFGSVYSLADRLKESIDRRPPPNAVLLDFTHVSGFDFSAVNVLARFLRSAISGGSKVVLSAPSEQVRTGLGRNLSPSHFASVQVEPSLDRALEHCEEIVIDEWKVNAERDFERRSSVLAGAVGVLERQLERQAGFEKLIEELGDWLDPCRYASRETLTGPGVPSDGLILLVSGKASARDAANRRLRQYGPGDAIWPLDPSDAALSVSADPTCTAMVLSHTARRRLEEREERLALKLYRYLMAERFGDDPLDRNDDDLELESIIQPKQGS